MDTLEELSQFYFKKIREARPSGPYRLAGFSASSMITLEVVRLLEAVGEEVEQLAFVDHFPLLWASPLHDFTNAPTEVDELRRIAASGTAELISESCKRDPNPARQAYGKELLAASQGQPVSSSVAYNWDLIRKLSALNSLYVTNITGGLSVWASMSNDARGETARSRLIEKLEATRAPITVYIADRGLCATLPDDWKDLGVSLCKRPITPITKHVYEAAHFDIFEKPDFSRSLERDWVAALLTEHKMATLVHNPVMKDLTRMFDIVDSKALRVMAETVRQDPPVGTEVCCQIF